MISQKPEHRPSPYFTVNQQELLINQIPLSQLVERVGHSPFYAYDRSVIQQKIKELREAMPQNISIHYAVKANPMPEVLNLIQPLTDGLDVASAKELRLALNTGIEPSNISFAGPGKHEQELRMAIASGIVIHVESQHELSTIIKLTKVLHKKAKIAIRVNPDFESKASGMKMGGGSQQFGIDSEEVVNIVKTLDDHCIDFHGFHIFTGSQNLNTELLLNNFKHIFELANQLMQDIQRPLPMLNIGGGLGIPYFPGDTPLDITALGKGLQQLMAQYQASFSSTQIILELGRFIVGESGLYICKVIDKKQSRGENFLIVNGGLHHHLAASGNFGQVIRRNFPVSIGNKMNISEEVSTHIVGPLCTPLDVLANKVELPLANIGDWVVIYQSGAYGYSASPKDFLSHPYPIEVLV